MASLKEIKSRIQSVKSTQKITSAMKMVSSAKLRKAQQRIQNFSPYEQKLTAILKSFLTAEESEQTSIFTETREIKKVAIVVFSSNSSLCGSFNSNVAKKLRQVIQQYEYLGKENILIYPIGKKIAQAGKKIGFTTTKHYEELADKPNYKEAQKIADELMLSFKEKKIDRVELIYHHFISKSSQKLEQKSLIPIVFEQNSDRNEEHSNQKKLVDNYIIEPNAQEIMSELIPKTIRLQLYTALLDSSASEHAARTIAMQTATDNADDLLAELNLQYNKSRQQAITAELLDIIGGSFGQE